MGAANRVSEHVSIRWEGGEHTICPVKPYGGRRFTVRVGYTGLIQLGPSFLTTGSFSPHHIPDLIDALREAHRIAMRPKPSERDETAK